MQDSRTQDACAEEMTQSALEKDSGTRKSLQIGCTALSYSTGGSHYFGRNLDLERGFGQQVVVTPCAFPLPFRHHETLTHHLAIIGMAAVADGYPLYFDAANEAGLAMAGLNYAGLAHYDDPAGRPGTDDVASFELIPWILGQATTLLQARALLERLVITNEDFSPDFPHSTLHWMLSDRTGRSLVVEDDADGLHVYDNPAGTMTNCPQFDRQLFNLNNYQSLSAGMPANSFAPGLDLDGYSRGLGSRGLPGGMDSMSRFVKVTFTRFNSIPRPDDAVPSANSPSGSGKAGSAGTSDETTRVTQFFHILHSVEQQKGCDEVAPGVFEYTIYSSCINLETGDYYYTTYENPRISVVHLRHTDLDARTLSSFPISAPSFDEIN